MSGSNADGNGRTGSAHAFRISAAISDRLRSVSDRVGQERTIDPKARIVGNRVTMDQPVGAIKATLGGYF